MARPFQQMGEAEYLQVPVMYYPNQLPQLGQQQPSQIPLLLISQQMSQQYQRVPAFGDHFSRWLGANGQGSSSTRSYQYNYSQLLAPASKLSGLPAPLVLPLLQISKSLPLQALLQLPQPPYAAAFLYSPMPLLVPSHGSFGGRGSDSSNYPLTPTSMGSDHKIGDDKDHAGSPTIDYSSLVSYTVSSMSKRRRRVDTKAPVCDSELSQHVCNKCGKVFQKPYNLKSHMKTHSSDRPFQCQFCPKTFARSHDRKRHELLHEGVKNFKCEGYLKDGTTKWGCGKKFARSDALTRHFRTETGWLCIKPLMDEAKDLERRR